MNMNSYKFNNKHYWLTTEDLSNIHPFFEVRVGEIEAGQEVSTILDLQDLVETGKIIFFDDYELFLIELNKYNLYVE
jgi:hypothetical protein